MRIAVLSDIHGNLPALEAILAALAPYDAVWHLGDVVGYGPQPNEVIARLAREGAVGVCGNHEAAALGRIDTAWFNEDARVAIEWTAARLDGGFARLAGGAARAAPGRRLHARPRQPARSHLGVPRVGARGPGLVRGPETAHALVGHTHDPRVFREDDGLVETLGPSDGSELELDRRRLLLNPGSVGQPRDGDPRACGPDPRHGARTRRAGSAWPTRSRRRRPCMRQAGLPRRLVDRLDCGL